MGAGGGPESNARRTYGRVALLRPFLVPNSHTGLSVTFIALDMVALGRSMSGFLSESSMFAVLCFDRWSAHLIVEH